MLIDKAGSATRTGLRIDDNTGKKVRFSKKSGEAIK